MDFCECCGASKGSGGGDCSARLMGGPHSFRKGNQKMACIHCNKRVGGKGSNCAKRFMGGCHEFE